jgi:hypothetical protein
MGTNRFFNLSNQTSEQNLIDDLNQEAIQIHGVDCIYLPRSHQKIDLILGEDVLSKFDDVYDIEVYVKSVDGYEGQGSLMSKFGMDIKDQIVFTMSRSRFDEVTSRELARPNEGDLLYFPTADLLFEIRYVEHESVFYNLGERYVYELRCENFVYSHEDFNTGIDAIDDMIEVAASSFFLELGAGTGTYQEGELIFQGTDLLNATATATLIQAIKPAGQAQIKNVWGFFTGGAGNIIGTKSGASYAFAFADTQALTDPLAKNAAIEQEADSVIDFSESNPFSEGDY